MIGNEDMKKASQLFNRRETLKAMSASRLAPFGRRLADPYACRGRDPCAATLVRMQLLGKLPIAGNLIHF